MKASLGSPEAADQDLNGNGIVDQADFSILKANLGQPPGPSCTDLASGCQTDPNLTISSGDAQSATVEPATRTVCGHRP